MPPRALLLPALLLLALIASTTVWLWPTTHTDVETLIPADPAFPLPPVPPRIATGRDYEQCLAMLDTDPATAATFALGWQSDNGGDAAAHCLALARIALGHTDEGAAMLEKLAAASPAPAAARAIVYSQAGQAWLLADDGTRAYAAATSALTLLPDDIDLLIERATIAGDLEHHADALADLDHAIKLAPTRTDAITLRAATWRHLGNLDAAQQDIDRALTLDADYPEALLERGILRQRLGNDDGAREDWERTIELAPDTPTADLAEQNLALLEAGPDRK